MPTNNYIYSTTVPSDLTGIYMPAIRLNIQALAGAAEQTAKKKGLKKASQSFKKAKNQTKKISNKTPKLIEETNALTYLDNNMVDLGNGVKVSPYELYNQTHSGVILGISEDQWNEQRPTGLKWVDISNSIPENSWYSFLKEPLRNLGYNRFHNRDLLTAGERVVVPALMGAAGGTSVGAGGEASLNLLNSAGKWILGTEGVNYSTVPFTGNSISLIASHYLPISEEGAHESMILGGPFAAKGAIKGIKVGAKQTGDLTRNLMAANSINRISKNGIVNPEYLPRIEVPEPTFLEPLIKSETAILPWWKTWKQANKAASKVRNGEMSLEEAKYHVGVGYGGNKTNFPSVVSEDGTVISTGVPTGTGRVTKVFDSRDPNLLLWKSPSIQAYESSIGEKFEPTINVSGGKNLNNLSPEVLDEMIGRLSMSIDPLFRGDLNSNNFRLSTNSGTPLNRSLLNRVSLNLKDGGNPIYEAGTNKANLPFSKETVDVPLYKLRDPLLETPKPAIPESLTTPLINVNEVPSYPFEGPIQTVKLGKQIMDLVKNTQNVQEKTDILKHYYPNLNDNEVNILLTDLGKMLNNSWMEALGFHPMVVENARLSTLGLRMQLAQNFNTRLFGYPENETILNGDITINKRGNNRVEEYFLTFLHPDGSEGELFFTHDHVIKPILRPGASGKVNRGVLIPMLKELKSIRLNPNFKGWTMYNDFFGRVNKPYDLTSAGKNTLMFSPNNLSMDSNELLYDVGRKYNIPVYQAPSIQEFNNMAFNNRKLTQKLYSVYNDIQRGILPPIAMRDVIRTDAYPYYDRIGAYRPVVGSRSATVIGAMPILGLKHGKKLIRRDAKN